MNVVLAVRPARKDKHAVESCNAHGVMVVQIHCLALLLRHIHGANGCTSISGLAKQQ